MQEEKAIEITKQEIEKSKSPLFPSEVSGVVTNTATSQASEVSTSGLIEQAREAIKALREELNRKEKLIIEEKELEARKLLGGKSTAGFEVKQKTKEEIDQDAAKDFLKKAGLDVYAR